MQRNQYVLKIGAAVLAVAVAGCGGGTTSTGQPQLTGLKKRVLLTNVAAGSVTIMDAQKDVFSAAVLGAPGGSKIVTSGGFTAVLGTAQSDITVIGNAQESATFYPGLSGPPVDGALS